jgi:hypothetical protein
MSEFEKYLKESILNPEAQALGDKWIESAKRDGNEGYHAHDRVFGSENHIVIPLEKATNPKKFDDSDIHPEIRNVLLKHGYRVHDYLNNVAVKEKFDINGEKREDRSSISKVLAREKDQTALKIFNNDKKRASSSSEDHEVVISRDPQSLLRMTSSRKWVGAHCTRLPGPEMKHPELTSHIDDDEMRKGGLFHHTIQNDIRHGTLIAYLVKKGDHDVENPIARVLLKRHHAFKDGSPLGEHRDVWVPETGHDFGHPTDDFLHTVNRWSHTNYPRLRKGETSVTFKKNQSLYDDDEPIFLAKKKGVHKTGEIEKNYNEFGRLHDRENGEPAYKKESFGETKYHFYNDGKLHREGDKPAVIEKSDNEHVEEYYKHGAIHRDGDNPARIKNYGSVKSKAYYKFGIMHRDYKFGPALDSNVQKYYVMNGIHHRPVTEGPAVIDKYGDYKYSEFGEEKRPPTGGPSSKQGSTHVWVGNDREPHVSYNEISNRIRIEDGEKTTFIDGGKKVHEIHKNGDISQPKDASEDHTALFNKYKELSKIVPKWEP